MNNNLKKSIWTYLFEAFTADHVHETQLEQTAAFTGTAKSQNSNL